MKLTTILLAIFLALVSIAAESAPIKKTKKKLKKSAKVVSPNVIAIGYPTINVALNAVKAHTDFDVKPNAKPFGWQERKGPWYVVNEPLSTGKQSHIEWAFTQPGHFAHPSVIKRMIDVGSKDHVYVDMAFRCASPAMANCDQLLDEFKEVNLFIRKVYQKKYIVTNDGTPAWNGVNSLD